MSSYEIFSAFRKMSKISKLLLVGMSLIVLKEPHNQDRLIIKPKYDSMGKIVGVNWTDDNFEIEIKNRRSNFFQIKSDLAKSFY